MRTATVQNGDMGGRCVAPRRAMGADRDERDDEMVSRCRVVKGGSGLDETLRDRQNGLKKI
jgi:hypothetical protein